MKTINKYISLKNELQSLSDCINERLVLTKNKVKNIPFDSIKPSERDKLKTFDNLWSMLHYWNRMYDNFHLECVYGEDIEDFPIIYSNKNGDKYLTELYVQDKKNVIYGTVFNKMENSFSRAPMSTLPYIADILGKNDNAKGLAVITFIEDYMRKNK